VANPRYFHELSSPESTVDRENFDKFLLVVRSGLGPRLEAGQRSQMTTLAVFQLLRGGDRSPTITLRQRFCAGFETGLRADEEEAWPPT
jgi:hypothetical protein